MTRVSTIIPTFNRSAKLIRALSSVLSQTYTDNEIIVVDDGSSDNTKEKVAPYLKHIHYIRHDENLGVSTARNNGIKAAQSPLIAFLDSDDYWLPKKLEIQVRFFEENRQAVACQTQEKWFRYGVAVNPRQKHLKPSGNIFEESLKLCLVSPSTVMCRRYVFDEVGLFDEDFPVCEDYDLWLRISCRYSIHLIDKILAVKEGGHPDQLSSSLKGMDRFRIKSMVKLLKSSTLNHEQTLAVIRELEYKCRIYGEGCLKRGKIDEGNYYLNLPRNIVTC